MGNMRDAVAHRMSQMVESAKNAKAFKARFGERLAVGDRVELHPALDLWAMGARYGQIVRVISEPEIGLEYARVHVDQIGQTRSISWEYLREVNE
jgi:hypothetical protein